VAAAATTDPLTHQDIRPRRDRLTRVLALSAAVLCGGAAVAGFLAVRTPPPELPPAAPLPGSTVTTVRSVPAPATTRGTPSTVTVPAINQHNVPVVAATVDGDQLSPPRDVRMAGIWTGGASLDATTGTTTLVGHVNYVHQGNGAFHDLSFVPVGSPVTTVDATGSATTWIVTAVSTTPKAAGVDPGALAGPAGPRRLVLVTCGGEYDRTLHSYRDNVYVWANPAGQGRTVVLADAVSLPGLSSVDG
jgi:Sortase domain